MTDQWDPSNPSHKELAHRIEIGNGIPEMRPVSKAREALISVGFEIEHEEDLAERPDEVPWYYPLEGDMFKAQTLWDYFTVWRMGPSGRFVTHHGLWLIEKLGIVPKGTWEVGETLKIAGDALVEAGQKRVCGAFDSHSAHILMSTCCSCSSSRRCTSSSAGSLSRQRTKNLPSGTSLLLYAFASIRSHQYFVRRVTMDLHIRNVPITLAPVSLRIDAFAYHAIIYHTNVQRIIVLVMFDSSFSDSCYNGLV